MIMLWLEIFSIFFLILTIHSYGMEVFDASGRKVESTESIESLNNNVGKSLDENPRVRYFYRAAIESTLNDPLAPKPVWAVGNSKYIEVEKNHNYKFCLDYAKEGVWESSFKFELSEDNCVIYTTPNYTGSFLFRFVQDSTPTDSIWVLCNQKLIDLSKDIHLIWSIDSIVGPFNKKLVYGSYKKKRLNKILVVDKTEATVGEVKYFCDYFGMTYKSSTLWYPDNNPLLNLNLPQDPGFAIVPNYANNRSRLEGFEITSRANGADTTKNGYRLPTHDEWVALQRGGAQGRYYWGNEDDSLTISQYEWYKPTGQRVHEVGLLKPNPYGLYDAMGNAKEALLFQGRECMSMNERSNECLIKRKMAQHKPSRFCYEEITRETMERNNSSLKSLPSTTKCTMKYDVLDFYGFRLVRQIQ